MFNKIKQKILKYKYNKAQNLYIVGCWGKWGVLPAKFSGKFDKDGNPLVIHWTDNNGFYEKYYIHKWYWETTGQTIAYFFNEEQAKSLVKVLNKNERFN